MTQSASVEGISKEIVTTAHRLLEHIEELELVQDDRMQGMELLSMLNSMNMDKSAAILRDVEGWVNKRKEKYEAFEKPLLMQIEDNTKTDSEIATEQATFLQKGMRAFDAKLISAKGKIADYTASILREPDGTHSHEDDEIVRIPTLQLTKAVSMDQISPKMDHYEEIEQMKEREAHLVKIVKSLSSELEHVGEELATYKAKYEEADMRRATAEKELCELNRTLKEASQREALLIEENERLALKSVLSISSSPLFEIPLRLPAPVKIPMGEKTESEEIHEISMRCFENFYYEIKPYGASKSGCDEPVISSVAKPVNPRNKRFANLGAAIESGSIGLENFKTEVTELQQIEHNSKHQKLESPRVTERQQGLLQPVGRIQQPDSSETLTTNETVGETPVPADVRQVTISHEAVESPGTTNQGVEESQPVTVADSKSIKQVPEIYDNNGNKIISLDGYEGPVYSKDGAVIGHQGPFFDKDGNVVENTAAYDGPVFDKDGVVIENPIAIDPDSYEFNQIMMSVPENEPEMSPLVPIGLMKKGDSSLRLFYKGQDGVGLIVDAEMKDKENGVSMIAPTRIKAVNQTSVYPTIVSHEMLMTQALRMERIASLQMQMAKLSGNDSVSLKTLNLACIGSRQYDGNEASRWAKLPARPLPVKLRAKQYPNSGRIQSAGTPYSSFTKALLPPLPKITRPQMPAVRKTCK